MLYIYSEEDYPEYEIQNIPFDASLAKEHHIVKCPPSIQKEFFKEYLSRKLGKNIVTENIKTMPNSKIEFIVTRDFSIRVTIFPLNIMYEFKLLLNNNENSIIGIKKYQQICVRNANLETLLLRFLYFIINKNKYLRYFFLPDSSLRKLTTYKLFDRNLLPLILSY